MKIKKFAISLIVITLVLIDANAQFRQIKTDEEILAWTEIYMNNAAKFDHFSGAVLIARNGKPIFSRAYGMKSSNAYLKLAMAYESIGDKVLAVKNFKQCLELNPSNKPALEHLKKLEK